MTTADSATEQRNPDTIEIDRWPSEQIVRFILAADETAVRAARDAANDLARLVDRALACTNAGGRVHYFGAGASGRLALLDATETTPTFGVPSDLFIPHFPGGPSAFLDSSLDLEDADSLGYADAEAVTPGDVVIGISASGSTSYVRGALRQAREIGAVTALLTSNPEAPLSPLADVRVVAATGAEVITGSTRLKAGTATKVLLNAFSTALMVRSGRTFSNLMVNVVATNDKLVRRAIGVLEMATWFPEGECRAALDHCGGDLRIALLHLLSGRNLDDCRAALAETGSIRDALGILG